MASLVLECLGKQSKAEISFSFPFKFTTHPWFLWSQSVLVCSIRLRFHSQLLSNSLHKYTSIYTYGFFGLGVQSQAEISFSVSFKFTTHGFFGLGVSWYVVLGWDLSQFVSNSLHMASLVLECLGMQPQTEIFVSVSFKFTTQDFFGLEVSWYVVLG